MVASYLQTKFAKTTSSSFTLIVEPIWPVCSVELGGFMQGPLGRDPLLVVVKWSEF